MSHHDPSWCARLDAHRAPAPIPPSVAAPSATAEVPIASTAPFRRREIPQEHHCECCGARMFDHHCKIVCPNCGYKRDCSDP